MATILAEEFSGELESYTRALLRRIAKKTNVSFEQLIDYAFGTDDVVEINTCTSDIELEYLNLNSVEYLFDSNTRYLYSYTTKEVLGKLNEYNEPMPIKLLMEDQPIITKRKTTKKTKKIGLNVTSSQ